MQRQKDISKIYIWQTNLNQSFVSSSADSSDRTSTWSLLIHRKPYTALPTFWAFSYSVQLRTLASSADTNDRTSTWSLLIHRKPYSAMPTVIPLIFALDCITIDVKHDMNSLDVDDCTRFFCKPVIILDISLEDGCPFVTRLLSAIFVTTDTILKYPSSSSSKHCRP